ncbi:MAG: protein-glutamate O-methyltransferase CheR [Proteobacteria bacterium]|nr:protein-glutamate O-methyltransferase CheR [Pseudomonadota bacterium]MBU4296027.1 protein-glutamate O-methyltransferase CheR [Pseudomonadota bacterium]MCG2747277.1 protein-glutamate O-methyltransferase CheR [Desulfobulbaceae bacterium]
MISITPEEVKLFAEFIHARSGIVLNSTKAYLLESRLGPLLDEYGAKSFAEFFYAGYRSEEWEARVVDAISTHETSFFRDQRPFELLQAKILPEFFGKRQNGSDPTPPRLQIWSAACSTGQEVYSLAMIIAELLGDEMKRWHITITGTDISDVAIKKAQKGLYTRYEVERGVPLGLCRKYFESQGELLKVRADLRAMTVFNKTNLLAAPEGPGVYDIILCRNVAIYFNQKNRRRLFQTMATCLRSEGVLIIGSTESIFGISDRFIRNESCNTIYFQKGRE